jgi:hypothetical protein
LRDLSRGEAVIGNDGRALRRHQQQICLQDRFAIERSVLVLADHPSAKTILAADIEGNPAFQLALVCF